MLNLIKNEWMKLWSKKGTWVMVILLSAVVIGFTGLAKLTETLFDDSGWTESLEADLVEIENELASPDLGVDEKEELEMRKTDTQGMITMSIESNKPGTRESTILETHGFMQVVTLLTIIVASGIVSTEFSQGTIKMLLSRPVSRWKVLTSKYITVLLYSFLLTVITYVSSVAAAYVFFPGTTESTMMFNDQMLTVSAIWGKSLYMMFLAFISAVIIATLAFMLGSVFRATSTAIGISIFLYFTGGPIVMFLSDYAFAKYILFAHTSLTSYEAGFAILPDITMSFSIAMIIIYGVLFLTISFWSFVKRDVMA